MEFEDYFIGNLNNRLSRLSYNPNSSFMTAQAVNEDYTSAISTLFIIIIPFENKILESITDVFIELAKV